MDVAIDLAMSRRDAVVRPTPDRAPEVDADELAEHAGVDAFGVVGRKSRCLCYLGHCRCHRGFVRSLSPRRYHKRGLTSSVVFAYAVTTAWVSASNSCCRV